MSTHEQFMDRAMDLARQAMAEGNRPAGSVIVKSSGLFPVAPSCEPPTKALHPASQNRTSMSAAPSHWSRKSTVAPPAGIVMR